MRELTDRLLEASADWVEDYQELCFEAHDRIKQMEEEWDWISVKDEMPDDDEFVLVVVHEDIDYWIDMDKINGGVWDDCHFMHYEVLFWMPLPHLPVEITFRMIQEMLDRIDAEKKREEEEEA